MSKVITLPKMDADLIQSTADAMAKDLESKLAPAGALGLDPLLDERRLKYGIPNGAFNFQAVYDRILVWQIPEEFNSGDTYGNSRIIMSDETKTRKRQMAPRGVIVSAGQSALDALRAHGMAVGHIIQFVALSPYRIPCDNVLGTDLHVIILRAGDVVSSEDLRKSLFDGTSHVEVHGCEHVYRDANGKVWANAPAVSPTGED